MRSGISCFNGPLFKKNMTRFWPVWALYGLLWLFLMPLQFLTIANRYSGQAALAAQLADLTQQTIPGLLSPGAAVSALFGLMAAMAVFSYLYSSRSACMMHALPMDRNTLFFTNYISGLFFLLLPNLAVFLLTLAMELLYGCLAPEALVTWLLVQSATALFFYSFAVFCAMFTGNLLALPIFYGILNFLAWVIYELLCEVLSVFLYGSWGLGLGLENAVYWCTPPVKLIAACSVLTEWTTVGDVTTAQLTSKIEAPTAVAVYAGVGVALTVLALLVYQRRHVETAGDVVSVSIVRPVFKYGVALCTGLCFGVYTANILDFEESLPLAVMVVLWAVAGYFVAEMLLRKSFRVLKCWKGAGVLACLLCLLFVAVELDWFGYESRVPNPQEVASIQLSGSSSGAPYDSAGWINGIEITQPEQIQEILDLHQAIVDNRDRQDEAGEDYINCYFTYTLENGQSFRRRYYSVPVFQEETDAPGTVSYAAQALLTDREFVYDLYGFDVCQSSRLVEAYLSDLWSEREHTYGDIYYLSQATGTDLEELWEAVLLDFEEGTIGVRYLIDGSPERMANTYTANLNFVWEEAAPGKSESVAAQKEVSITLTPQASRTLAKLEELGAFGDGAGLVTHQEMRG